MRLPTQTPPHISRSCRRALRLRRSPRRRGAPRWSGAAACATPSAIAVALRASLAAVAILLTAGLAAIAILLTAALAASPACANAASPGVVSASADLAAAAVATPAWCPPNQAWRVDYTAWNGARRRACVLLPAGYSATTDGALPCVIAAHGRGMSAEETALRWGSLPTDLDFAVVCADSAGVREAYDSWAAPGQLYDLMRLPSLAEAALPAAQFDDSRLYAVGLSMGAQEVLCLAARYPDRLAGVAACDGVTDLSARYTEVLQSARGGLGVQRRMRHEMGGTPRKAAFAYRLRSPRTYAATLASAGIPIQLWWSPFDIRVINQATTQTGAFYGRIQSTWAAPQIVQVQTQLAHGVAFRSGKGLEQMIAGFRPNGTWAAASSRPPEYLAYVSGLTRAQFWGYSVRLARRTPSIWQVERLGACQTQVRSRVALSLTLPCSTASATAIVTVNGQAQTVAVINGSCTVELPAGSSTVVLPAAQAGGR